MLSHRLRYFIFFNIFAALIAMAVSCNSKDNSEESEIVVTPAIVAVKNFYLKANDSVMSKLDSVSFSIDLNKGAIFNSDSLPVGTNVTRLIPVITFANTMTKVELSFLKDNAEEVTVDYLTTPEDSIDFTYPVVLNVTAQDGISSFQYQIKVNIHKENPDTLYWTNLQISNLPSRFENPVAQKTVIVDNDVFCFIEEKNGEFTLSKSHDLNEGNWDKRNMNLNFIPVIESFTATEDSFYLLNDAGELFVSLDADSWILEDKDWVSILGAYGNEILGIRKNEETLMHCRYPNIENYPETPVEQNFPVYNASELGVVNNSWTSQPFAIRACGINLNNELSSLVWAFDGDKWAVINENVLPALSNPMLAHYVVFRETSSDFKQRQLDAWLLIGGENESGLTNRSVYMSYDNGVSWKLAPESMQLPEDFPVLYKSDILVAGYYLSADLSEAWSWAGKDATRSDYTIEGFDITWKCPYMYIFGGYDENDKLSDSIWRGVLARLRFTPQI